MKTTSIGDRKRGFTLIELLVVIAIIAILASILFPVFGRAREQARRTACTSNVKQLLLGVMQYTQDYDELYPKWDGGASWGMPEGTGWWMNQIQPYVKSTGLFACPSDGRGENQTRGWGFAVVPGSTQNGTQPPRYYKTSYGINEWIVGGAYISDASIQNAAQTVIIAEAVGPLFHDWDNGQGFYGRMAYSRLGDWGTWEDYQNVARWEQFSGHLQSSNVIGYVDGHVASMQTRRMRWPGNPDRNNPQVESPIVAPFNLPG